MTVCRWILKLYGPLLLVAAMPLHAQFTTYGCPAGVSQVNQLNGFTAGTSAASTICLSGSFLTSDPYDITVTDTNIPTQTATITGIYPTSSATLLVVPVPTNVYATVSTPGQPDPVSISIIVPGVNTTAQTGTFLINPPLAAGGPIYLSAFNTSIPVTWTLSTGGTPPYTNEFQNGTTPNGMPAFPLSGQTWTGTPTQTGTFTFIINTSDPWGNSVTPTLYAYIVPNPALTNLGQTYAVVGSGNISLLINGSGFVAPILLDQVPEAGSSVLWTNGTNTTTLTPSAYSANQLTVTLPSGLFLSSGIWAIVVVNPGPSGSGGLPFDVDPSATGLSTYSRTAGAPAFQLGITGTGFVNGSVAKLNGNSLPTTFVSGTNLTATFPSISTPAVEIVTVLNPDTTLTPNAQDLSIQPPPTIGSLNPSSVNAGSPAFALTVTGTGFLNGVTVYFNSIPLPTTVVQNEQSNRLVANVPASAVANAGTVPVSVGTSDGYYTPSLPFTIVSTTPPIPPVQLLAPGPTPSGVINTPYTFTLTASGGTGGGYTFSVFSGTLPAGLQLSSGGTISGTPTAIGLSTFTVQVTDSGGNSASGIFTIRIAPQPLMLTTGPLASTQVNTPVNVQFAGSGGVPPYTFVEFGALPPGLQISTTGLLSGTPTKAGSYPFVLFLNDSTEASVKGNYTLNVAPPGLLITAPSPLPSGQINVPYTTQLAATGGAGAPYTWSATGLPQGLTIANNTGLIAGIPRVSGDFTVGVTVADVSGAAASQNYALTIASATLTFFTTSLPNGAVGSSYSATVSATGGSAPYTYAASGLPPGLTMGSSGTISGTPTAAGSYTVAVTATDSTGTTASTSYEVTIGAQLTVTPATIPNGVVGVAISPVTLTATGGTPPYQWQSADLPPGLSLALNGTLSGTPSSAGTFSFTVYAVDNNGTLSSGTDQVTVALPVAPAASISGLPPTNAPATQPSLQVVLANPYPATITANLTLTFAPVSGADDPSIQFVTGGRTAQIVIPAGSTSGLAGVALQTGTVAGTITISAQLFAGSVNVTPTPAPTQSITVSPSEPVITGVTATRTSTGFTVTVTGYASNRDVDSGNFQFSASEGASLLTTQLSVPVTSLFTTWYGSSTSAPYGSEFTLSQPFAVNGDTSSVLSVTVTLTNALGTSPAATANLQ